MHLIWGSYTFAMHCIHQPWTLRRPPVQNGRPHDMCSTPTLADAGSVAPRVEMSYKPASEGAERNRCGGSPLGLRSPAVGVVRMRASDGAGGDGGVHVALCVATQQRSRPHAALHEARSPRGFRTSRPRTRRSSRRCRGSFASTAGTSVGTSSGGQRTHWVHVVVTSARRHHRKMVPKGGPRVWAQQDAVLVIPAVCLWGPVAAATSPY